VKITRLEEESIRLVVALAKSGGRSTLPELARAERMTEALVAKIMGRLRKGGIIRALRGRLGGYELIPSPETLTVAAIIRALGQSVFEGCASQKDKGSPCPHISDCSLRPVWNHLASAVTDTLDRITVSQLFQNEHPMRKQLASLKIV
jgi:Rrf2 family protein